MNFYIRIAAFPRASILDFISWCGFEIRATHFSVIFGSLGLTNSFLKDKIFRLLDIAVAVTIAAVAISHNEKLKCNWYNLLY